jgi:phage shock protein A
MKGELERMEAKQQELNARKNTLGAQLKQARSGGGAEGLGAKAAGASAFAEFRRMEDQIEGHVAEVAAHKEVEDALSEGGLSREELEAKFNQLEHGGAKGQGSTDKTQAPEIDDELAKLKQKIRIG